MNVNFRIIVIRIVIAIVGVVILAEQSDLVLTMFASVTIKLFLFLLVHYIYSGKNRSMISKKLSSIDETIVELHLKCL